LEEILGTVEEILGTVSSKITHTKLAEDPNWLGPKGVGDAETNVLVGRSSSACFESLRAEVAPANGSWADGDYRARADAIGVRCGCLALYGRG